MDEIVKLDSIDRYHKLYGFETRHPLVSVVDLRKATRTVNHVKMNYGIYAVFLKEGKSCDIRYGRRSYDYQEGTIVSFAPGQVVEVDMKPLQEKEPEVLGLLFHPSLIRGTSLGSHIRDYAFFSYQSNEALHLSQREKTVFSECLRNIDSELEHPIDRLSRQLICNNIELLLNYCLRFYERQFITRQDDNRDVLQKFERMIHEYLDSTLPQEKGLPSVKYFADKVCLSPNYFGDLVKKETGKSAQEYIQFVLTERAKELISQTDMTMSQVAYSLGFRYPQHFGRMFKRVVGVSPLQFRE